MGRTWIGTGRQIGRAAAVALAAAGLCAAAAGAGHAAGMGDGPRTYQLLPDGAQVASVYSFFLRGDVLPDPALSFPGSDVDVDMAVLQYTRTFDLGGQQSAFFIGLPLGGVSGEVIFPRLTVSSDTRGAGDLIAGAVFGLTGAPSLALADYVAFDPGFAMGWLVKASLPTGSYDSGRGLNMGSNRWSLQTGPLIGFALGRSYLDADLMTFELLPTVTVFSDNDDPFGPADRGGQDPLYRVEAHVTRNLSRAVWVSLDALYTSGGETFTNGQGNDDAQDSLGIGVTASVALSRSSFVKASYGEVVSGVSDGTDNRGLRVLWSSIF